MKKVTTIVDISALSRLCSELSRQLNGSGGPIQKCFKRWALRYRTFLRRRFDRFSKGGGTWAPLAVRTIAARLARQKKSVKRLSSSDFKFDDKTRIATKIKRIDFGKITGKPKSQRKSKKSRKSKTATAKARRRRKGSVKRTAKAVGKALRGMFKGAKKGAKKAKRSLFAAKREVRRVRKKSTVKFTFARDTAKGGVTIRVSGSFSILRDYGILYAVLDPVFASAPGALEQVINGGIRVGFGGPAKHPGGKKTIAQIAGFHQRGGGRLPKRTIIVPPDDATLKGMQRDMQLALKEIVKG